MEGDQANGWTITKNIKKLGVVPFFGCGRTSGQATGKGWTRKFYAIFPSFIWIILRRFLLLFDHVQWLAFLVTTQSVTISTIHNVKGFDYACVFVIGLDWLDETRWTADKHSAKRWQARLKPKSVSVKIRIAAGLAVKLQFLQKCVTRRRKCTAETVAKRFIHKSSGRKMPRRWLIY